MLKTTLTVQMGGGDLTEAKVNYSNGLYEIAVPISSPTGNVEIYASNGEANSNVLIATIPYAMSLKDVKPEAFVSRRNKNDVLISVNSNVDSNKVLYQITSEPAISDLQDSYITPNGEIDITGLEENTEYTFTISHMLIGVDESFSTAVTTINIKPYNSESISNLNLSIDANSNLVVSGVDDLSSVKIAKYTTANLDDSTIQTFDITNTNGVFKASDFKGLESGYFFAYVDNNTNKRSNIVKYTAPIIIKETKTNWQSIELNVDLASSITTEDKDFQVIGKPSLKVNVTSTGLKITGLKSNTEYKDLRITHKIDPNIITTVENIKTKSFVGKYSWAGTLTPAKEGFNFKIVVEDASSGSEYPYYVYFSDDDSDIMGTVNEGKKLRIMPLVDTSLGEPETPAEGVDTSISYDTEPFGKNNAAYTANGNKWNWLSSILPMANPKKWLINKVDLNKVDTVKTTVFTSINNEDPPTQALTTDTTFKFAEQTINGVLVPSVVFTNKGIPDNSLVNSGLYKNASPNKELGEDEYTFCLQLDEEVTL